MSYPPVFAITSASVAVQARLGSVPGCRVYMFGRAPQNVAKPYAVWQVVPGGSPENRLDRAPDMDRFNIQIDVYGENSDDSRLSAEALRDAIEPHAYVTGWRGEDQEPETKLHRSSFDVSWFVKR